MSISISLLLLPLLLSNISSSWLASFMTLFKDVLLFGSSGFLLVGDILLGGIDAEDLYISGKQSNLLGSALGNNTFLRLFVSTFMCFHSKWSSHMNVDLLTSEKSGFFFSSLLINFNHLFFFLLVQLESGRMKFWNYPTFGLEPILTKRYAEPLSSAFLLRLNSVFVADASSLPSLVDAIINYNRFESSKEQEIGG